MNKLIDKIKETHRYNMDSDILALIEYCQKLEAVLEAAIKVKDYYTADYDDFDFQNHEFDELVMDLRKSIEKVRE